MAAFCPWCGAPTGEGSRYCVQCGAALVTLCPGCGEPLPSAARFCPTCGTPAPGARADESGPTEERRLVTILFADIAGFTSRSDRADPEDVRRPLLSFHARVKEDIEWFGGTLDKFIGDGAMGVYGAPVAHEDDPERAVRTALRILDTVRRLNEEDPSLGLAVRIGIETGEAVVALGGAGPLVGERVAGDVVNTASRIQGVAPIGGIVIGQATHALVAGIVEAEPVEPVTVKGKAEPLLLYRVNGIRSRAQPVTGARAPFVGREAELEQLERTFAEVVGGPTVRLVTVVGEPGIGKSRLVLEFLGRLDLLPAPPRTLVGDCSPFGEGAAAPFREIVRTDVGISDADDPDEAIAKLSARLAELEPRPTEQEWLSARLASLAGLSGGAGGAVDREESFAAWQRFLWAVASERPLVLVVDGLQWADPATLSFLRHLAQRLARVPVLLLCTARPEFLQEHPDWPTSPPRAASIPLARLADDAMAVLLTVLLGAAALPAETMASLVDAAGGNALYAHEFVRMLASGAGGAEATEGGQARIAVPASVQSLVATHLDALPLQERLLIQDAAVVGDAVWPGALAAMSDGDERRIDERLRSLADRGLLRPSTGRPVAGDVEYVFAYPLLREVAYGQIPRGARAGKHRAAAEWAESAAGERVGELAEFLAFHYATAWGLLRAASATDGAEQVEERARRYLVMAGDRALGVDEARADAHYRSALELAPPGHPGRPAVLLAWARTGRRLGRLSSREALEGYEEAERGFLDRDDRPRAGEAMVRAAFELEILAERTRARERIDAAIELLEAQPPGRELALAYAARAQEESHAGRSAECLEWARRALLLARDPGLEEVAVMAHHLGGNARLALGDPTGLNDLREAVRVSSGAGLGLETVRATSSLGDWLWLTERPSAGLEFHDQAIELADRRGFPFQAAWARARSLAPLFDLGAWDELVGRAGEVIGAEPNDGGVAPIATTMLARVLAARGRVPNAVALMEGSLAAARELGDLELLANALVSAACVEEAGGRAGRAAELVEELEEATRGGSPTYREHHLPDAIRICLAAGASDLAERLLADARSQVARFRHCVAMARALAQEAAGEIEPALGGFLAATRGWASFGAPFERARALLGAGRCLYAVGRNAEATARVEEARGSFAAVTATPSADEATILLTAIASS